MGLSELGFDRPTYDELLTAQINRAKQLFGETIDTSELTALGKYIRINVADLDTLYQTLEGVYYARFPNTASGVNLDRLLPFVGITRNAATYARHKVKFTGTAGATIDASFEVSNENQSVIFHTVDDYIIGSDGTVECYVDCNEVGTVGNILSTAINTIVNPSADVDSVTGLSLVTAGEERESDNALRARFSKAVAGSGSNTAEAIKAAIMRVPLVDSVSITENATGNTAGVIPPYSFECVVLAPDSQNQLIAEAIFSKKPIGIRAYGNRYYDVSDDNGTVHKIGFSKTTEITVYIKAVIDTESYFDPESIATMKQNLINTIAKLGNGEYVSMSSLYGCIHLDGVKTVKSLKIGVKNGSTYTWYTSDLPIGAYEVARASADRIEITEYEASTAEVT